MTRKKLCRLLSILLCLCMTVSWLSALTFSVSALDIDLDNYVFLNAAPSPLPLAAQ